MALPKGINLRLKSVAKIKNLAERSVQISSVLAEALRTIGQDPILVGGAAVEFYTQGGYSTSDIDLIAEGGPKLMGVMKELGFNRLGKDFIHKEFKIYVEFPGRSLKPSERYQTLQIENRHLFIISLEDLIVDRLSAFKFWKSAIDGVNAIYFWRPLKSMKSVCKKGLMRMK